MGSSHLHLLEWVSSDFHHLEELHCGLMSLMDPWYFHCVVPFHVLQCIKFATKKITDGLCSYFPLSFLRPTKQKHGSQSFFLQVRSTSEVWSFAVSVKQKVQLKVNWHSWIYIITTSTWRLANQASTSSPRLNYTRIHRAATRSTSTTNATTRVRYYVGFL